MATSTSQNARPEDEPPTGEPPRWEDDEDRPRPGRSIVEWVVVVAGAVLVALVIKTFVVQAFYIPSESMEPTLLKNDRVLVNKVSYRLHGVNRGDVIVFEHSAVEGGTEIKDLIKRVVGLPGEQIAFEQDHVLIDGQALSEPYLPAGTATKPAPRELAFGERQCTRAEPCTVPPASVWVMGDNRTNSQDSRYIGPVAQDVIVGRSFVIVWPFNRLGGL
jgi:signal peptidase I